jgi:hypothetical protein
MGAAAVKLLRSIAEEIVGLFVDDWRFALLLVGWVAIGWLMARQIPAAAGPLFFAGLAAITLGFVYVRAVDR